MELFWVMKLIDGKLLKFLIVSMINPVAGAGDWANGRYVKTYGVDAFTIE